MRGPAPAPIFDGPLAEYLAETPPAEELDAGPTLGWFGLYPNRELPGGAILHHCDDDGFVTSWYTPSTTRLDEQWAQIRAAAQALAAETPG